MDDGLLLARMILAIATVIFALSLMHSANADPVALQLSVIHGHFIEFAG